MKNIMRLTMALIFCVTLILCLTPYASAESGTWSNLNWTLDDTGQLTISGSGNMDNFYNWSTTAWCSQKNAIKAVVIESGVTSIGNYAFSNCRNLTSVIIGKNISRIGSSVFTNCDELNNISVDSANLTYHDRNGVLFNSNTNEIVCFPAARSGSYFIPNDVKSIGRNAFDSCRKLTSVTIPDSVTNIGYWAFNCCYGLTSVTIPDSVTTLDDGVFCNCGGLSNVTIGANVNSIGEDIFGACGRLTNIYVNPANASYHDRDGVLFKTNEKEIVCFPCGRSGAYIIPNDVKSIGKYAFSGCGISSITIPGSVTKIGERAFYVCTELTSIIIPDSVTSIEYGAFDACIKLTSVTIPNGITNIPEWAFSECRSLKSVTIPDGVASIGRYAFQVCEELTSVIIPDSVKNIGTGAFQGCSNLEDVYYNGTQEQWSQISIGSNNTPLTDAKKHYVYEWLQPDFILPAALTEIGEEAFSGGAFTYVKLSESCVKIGPNAFAGCPNLKYISIPNTKAEIDEDAFGNLTGLTIFGKSGSTAQTYAQAHSFTFIPTT